MNEYFNQLIKLILDKKYKEAYELSEKMHDIFKNKCKNGEYTNVEMARNDYFRWYSYHETASKLYVRQMHRETMEFEKACNNIMQIIKEACSGEG